ncbi:magnesium transporter [Mycena pura]|uniref:Magnesium transporter n=1 Tax=Mycena pura TaxID=153505 RepID=A0AAD6USK8_9AGAR|nr:magnesium transporter [Mycena pura]
MPRENSFSDEGRSLTPDLDEEAGLYAPASPTHASPTRASYPPNPHVTPTKDPAWPRQSKVYPPSTSAPLHPRERFRIAVRKVISLHRGANVMARRTVGGEPGVDPRRANADAEHGMIKEECAIELADYSALRTRFRRMDNREFVDLMSDPNASQREPWVKVRWINIGGVSWDVIKAVSIRYDLHPLALEDVFHGQTRARSKADYYTQHLFLRILFHELDDEDEPSRNAPMRFNQARAMSTISDGPPRDEKPFIALPRKRWPWLHRQRSTPALALAALRAAAVPAGEQRLMQPEDAALRALKSGERVNVGVFPMFIFLLRDGTVITIHPTPSLKLTQPITGRLHQLDSGLRTSADASILVQSLLSLGADMALEVITAYQRKIKKFERKILMKPTIETVRNLHILSADLLLHRRTLGPIKTVVYGLRRYDTDRVAALVDMSAPENKDVKVVGFMSHNSLVYLADVHDHMEYVLSQLDVIAGVGQNLVDYTFNMTSYETNEVMRRLMLVTVIFLPLTLLTGYFGMNFENMWSVKHQHADWIYWAIALPIMAIVLPLFLGPDIRRMVHYARKKVLTRKAIKGFKAV